MKTDHLIMSKKHTNGIALWWRPEGKGYTNDLNAAGRFTQTEAELCETSSHGEDIAVPESVLPQLAVRMIVDLGDQGNRQLLR